MIKDTNLDALKTIDRDLFNRGIFLDQVETVINETTKDVILLNSRWGTGKTTVVNFLDERIDSSQYLFIRYNPWMFQDDKDLHNQFFNTLITELMKFKGEISYDLITILIEMNIFLATLGMENLDEHFAFYALMFATHKGLATFVKKLKKKKKTPSLADLKSKFEKELKKQKRKILVVIDDIDRLTNKRIFETLSLIKTVGDFDNSIYLILAEEGLLTDAISVVNGGKRSELYLEKIFTLTIDLPQPSQFELRKILYESIDVVLSDISQLNFKGYDDEVIYNFRLLIELEYITIRSIKKFIKIIKFTLPQKAKYTNVYDLLIIEYIRVFYNKVYQRLVENENILSFDNSNIKDDGIIPPEYISKEILKKKLDSMVDEFTKQDKEVMKFCLSRLFSNLGYRHGGDLKPNKLPNRQTRSIQINDFFKSYYYNFTSEIMLYQEAVDLFSEFHTSKDTDALFNNILEEGKIDSFIAEIDSMDFDSVIFYETYLMNFVKAGCNYYINTKGSNFVSLFVESEKSKILRFTVRTFMKCFDQEDHYNKDLYEMLIDSLSLEHALLIYGYFDYEKYRFESGYNPNSKVFYKLNSLTDEDIIKSNNRNQLLWHLLKFDKAKASNIMSDVMQNLSSSSEVYEFLKSYVVLANNGRESYEVLDIELFTRDFDIEKKLVDDKLFILEEDFKGEIQTYIRNYSSYS